MISNWPTLNIVIARRPDDATACLSRARIHFVEAKTRMRYQIWMSPFCSTRTMRPPTFCGESSTATWTNMTW